MRWHFGTHSLWLDALLGLEAVGKFLVLPQLNMLDFVDSLTVSEEQKELGCRGGVRLVGGGEGGETIVGV